MSNLIHPESRVIVQLLEFIASQENYEHSCVVSGTTFTHEWLLYHMGAELNTFRTIAVRVLRERIITQFQFRSEVADDALLLVDGHLALRILQGVGELEKMEVA